MEEVRRLEMTEGLSPDHDVDGDGIPDELDRLDEGSRLPPEYPGWMFRMQRQRSDQLAELGRPNAR